VQIKTATPRSNRKSKTDWNKGYIIIKEEGDAEKKDKLLKVITKKIIFSQVL
jgi:hypothetical protein